MTTQCGEQSRDVRTDISGPDHQHTRPVQHGGFARQPLVRLLGGMQIDDLL